MRSTRKMVIAAILACSVAAYGASVVVYTVETGGNNNASLWENAQKPAYVGGVTDGSTVVEQGDDLNWAVRVSVGGVHEGTPGEGYGVLGAANLVFDLVVLDAAGEPVAGLGAAPLGCTSGTPGTPGATGCNPTDKGFWSSINDGDEDGIRGLDKLANAALARSIHNQASAPSSLLTLEDDAANSSGVRLANPGPNFDYGWYPTANGRGGIDLDGTKPINTSINKPELDGMLVGFGVGYKNYNYTYYTPGVGQYWVDPGIELGFGADVGDPLSPTAPERPLFEGQLSTKNLPVGTYYLKVLPSQNGNNIIHGFVNWSDPNGEYNAGSFASKADSATVLQAQDNGVKFVVSEPPPPQFVTSIAARKIYYNNSYYDTLSVGIDTGTGTRSDYAAVDTSKSPLMAGGGVCTPVNWTGYMKGINGLIYEVLVGDGQPDPVAGDFTFTNMSRTGITSLGTVSPTASAKVVLVAGDSVTQRKVRMYFTFADNSLRTTWLKVDIGTGFGLAAAETHYWGNAPGDTLDNISPNILVNPTDMSNVRAHPTTPSNRSPVTDPYDVDKTSLVNPTDQSAIRGVPTTPSTCLKFITK